MSDFVALWAFFEEFCATGGAGVWFVFWVVFGWDDFVYGSSCPEEKFSGAGSDGVFTYWTEEAFVGFAVLFCEPLCFWECNNPNEVYQNFAYGNQKSEDKYVFEISGWEVFVYYK